MTTQPYTTAPNRKGEEVPITVAKVKEWEATFGPWVQREILSAVQYIRDEMCDPKGKRYKNPVRMVGNWLRRCSKDLTTKVTPVRETDPELVKRVRDWYWSPEQVEARERVRRDHRERVGRVSK